MPTGVYHFSCNSVEESMSELQRGAAGSNHREKGRTSNTLCLPKDPQYRSHTASTWIAELYEVECKFFGDTCITTSFA